MSLEIIRYLKSFFAEYSGLFFWGATKAKIDEFESLEKNRLDLEIKNDKLWKKGFRKLIISNPDFFDVAYQFYNVSIYQDKQFSYKKGFPILITVVKNEEYRIRKFIEHYRKLGIQQFAIINNMSTDGTIDYLLHQKDVAIFNAQDDYTTNRREAWINRVIAYYGRNQWYVIADSDELLVYIGCENHNINELIKNIEQKRIKRVRALMVDMYTEHSIFENEHKTDPYSLYKFFDTDTYKLQKCKEMDLVRGGFRGRVFDSNPVLTKYPLIYFGKNDIQCKSHFLFPYKYNINTKCYLALLHYKFLPGDLKKYEEIARKGNFYGGSIQYKDYIKKYKEKNIQDTIYDGSAEYMSSYDLKKIKLITPIKWSKER